MLFGRYNKMPWASKRYMRLLPYIRSKGIFLMPVAHMMLHGIFKDLLVFALIAVILMGNDVQFSQAQRARVSVRKPS